MKVAITILIVLHLFVTIWHGQAHASLGITLPLVGNLFVIVVIAIGPIIAGMLVWTRYQRIGVWIFFLCMLGSFLFGTYHHYVAVSADNIHHLPPGSGAAQVAFINSAAALALVEVCSALYGALCIYRFRRTSAVRG